MKNAIHLRNSVAGTWFDKEESAPAKSNRASLFRKNTLCILSCVMTVLISTNAQASGWDKSFKTPDEWFSDWRYRSGENEKTLGMPCRLALRELDEIGVFPMADSSIKARTQKWVNDNIASPSKYYLKKLPKSKLQRDKILKQRQDFLEDKLGEIRKEIEEAYSRCEIYNLPKDRFDEIAKCYAKCVGTRAWKDVGVSVKSFHEVLDKMLPLCKLRNEIYVDIIDAQKAWFRVLTLKNPTAANTARYRAEINRLKTRVRDAEFAAANAQMDAMAAQSAANAAHNEAAQARENAERARNDANRANARLQENGIW